jgi:hypothetical protein
MREERENEIKKERKKRKEKGPARIGIKVVMFQIY